MHQRGRRRRIRRIRADGMWYGYGPQQADSVSGWLFPKRLMLHDEGHPGLVSAFYQDNSRERRKEW